MTIFATSDWRALCSELNQWVVELAASHPNLSQAGIAKIVAVTDRADTALAQPEPEGPTDEAWQESIKQVQHAQSEPKGAADCRALALHLRKHVSECSGNWAHVNIDSLLDAAEHLERLATLAQSEPEVTVSKWPDHWSRAQREKEAQVLCSQAGLDPVQRKRLCRDARDGMPLQVIHDLIAAELDGGTTTPAES